FVPAMVSVSSVSFSYTPSTSLAFPDFAVKAGEHFLLLGESGSGKSTLLHLLGGLLRQYTGSVKIDNTELASLTETSLDHFRGQKIGFVFQKNHLIPSLTVEQNLMLSPYLAGLKINKKKIHEVADELDIAGRLRSHVATLSHGQAQRVAIARAVLNEPSVILADEPTSALDDKNCDRVIHLLMKVAEHHHASLIIATHDQRLTSVFKKQLRLSPQ